MKADTNFPGGKELLRSVMKKIGFKLKQIKIRGYSRRVLPSVIKTV
jgi:hypothetical protein